MGNGAMVKIQIPQSIDSYLEQLTHEDPRMRYEAISFFARSVFVDRFWEVYNAVWACTEDANPRVHCAAGIAASMISARHFPLMNPGMTSSIIGDIPDYLGTWE